MGKVLFVLAVVIGAVVVVKRRALSRDGFDIQTFVARMPDNAPPKWAFNNITAIRENTDRILEFLERDQKSGTGGATMPLHDEESA